MASDRRIAGKLSRAFAEASPGMRAYMALSLLLIPVGCALLFIGVSTHQHALLIAGVIVLVLSMLDSAVSPAIRHRRRRHTKD